MLAVARGRPYAAIARDHGVSERTIRRRASAPGFEARVREARASAYRQVVDELAGLALEAVRTLADLMRSAENEAVRERAAARVLDAAASWREVIDVEDRLAALEQRAGLSDPDRSRPLRSV